jgi:hypothetical protein
MTYQEEYDWLVKAIDETQTAIVNNPKDKLRLIDELKELQKDLKELRQQKNPFRIWLAAPIEIERRLL